MSVLYYTKNTKNQKGLTLIELLAIMVILGIIAIIAIPIIANLIEESRERAIAAEAVHIISAAKILQATEVADGSNTEWVEDDLIEYMATTVAPFSHVQYINGQYAIIGHEVFEIFEDAEEDTPITDQMLASFLSGN